jgi:antirestriction protein ArdC
LGESKRYSIAVIFSGQFGSEAYVMKKVVAEIGSAFLAAELGLEVDPRTPEERQEERSSRQQRKPNRQQKPRYERKLEA